MNANPTPAEISHMLVSNNPADAWATALSIVRRINPEYDPALARMAFDDVMRVFHGGFPGYCPIKTLYHNMSHTLTVFSVCGQVAAWHACSGCSHKRR